MTGDVTGDIFAVGTTGREYLLSAVTDLTFQSGPICKNVSIKAWLNAQYDGINNYQWTQLVNRKHNVVRDLTFIIHISH